MSQQRTASIDRFKRLTKELQQDIRKNAIDELNLSADELVEQMRSAAPLGPTGNLRKSIRKEPGRIDTRVFIKAGGPLTTRKYVRAIKAGRHGIARSGGTYDYSRAVEFGTQDNPAHPFFWPSWRLRRKRIRSRMKRRITKDIKKRSAE